MIAYSQQQWQMQPVSITNRRIKNGDRGGRGAGISQVYVPIGSPETRVFILVALARVNMSRWFKPMTHVYTRERHENKNTRFWATYDVPANRKEGSTHGIK